MAKLPDGSFYRVISTLRGHVWLPLYWGASLQTAEKRFDARVKKEQKFGLIDRLEIRLYLPDAVSYQVVRVWRRDMDCNQIYILLEYINRPKFEEKVYHKVSDLSSKNAEVAADALAPLIAQYNLQICYGRRDYWAYWHEHDCRCLFQDQHGERVLLAKEETHA